MIRVRLGEARADGVGCAFDGHFNLVRGLYRAEVGVLIPEGEDHLGAMFNSAVFSLMNTCKQV